MTMRSKLRDLAAAAYYKYLTPPEPNNLGERDVEYSWFTARIPQNRGGYALDVGGATSWLSLFLGRVGYDVTSIDLSAAVPLFKRPLVRSIRRDFLNFVSNSSVGQFNLIVSCSVIENMGLDRYGEGLDSWADTKHMEACLRLLKPGGRLLLSTQIGKHKVVPKLHKIYDAIDMTRLLVDESVWRRISTEYWTKIQGNVWEEVSIKEAYVVDGAYYNYALGLFELEKV